MRRAKFPKVVQKDGETILSFLSRARAALVDANYKLIAYTAREKTVMARANSETSSSAVSLTMR